MLKDALKILGIMILNALFLATIAAIPVFFISKCVAHIEKQPETQIVEKATKKFIQTKLDELKEYAEEKEN